MLLLFLIGACEEVKALMLKYQANVNVAPMICRAIFILVSGSNEHKVVDISKSFSYHL